MRHYVTWAIGFAFLIISHQSIFNVNIYVIVLSNRTKLNNYTFIKELGEGANGIVYLVENNLLKRKEALKIWRKKSLIIRFQS